MFLSNFRRPSQVSATLGVSSVCVMALCTKIFFPFTYILSKVRDYNGAGNQQAIGRTRCFGLLLLLAGMILSIYLIGFGIHAYQDVGYFTYIIGSNAIYFATCSMILLGLVMFITTPLGFFSILTADTVLVVVYMFICFATISLCAVGGILGLILRDYIQTETVSEWMNDGMIHEYGEPSDHVTEAFDTMQSRLLCCGLDNVSWHNTAWFRNQAELPRKRIPTSCCATCATIHEKFCTAFFIKELPKGAKASKWQKICLKASDKCSSADSTIASEEMCHTVRGTKDNLSSAFRHRQSCTAKVLELLKFYVDRIIPYNIVALVLLCASIMTWLFLHELTFLYNPVPQMIRRK